MDDISVYEFKVVFLQKERLVLMSDGFDTHSTIHEWKETCFNPISEITKNEPIKTNTQAKHILRGKNKRNQENTMSCEHEWVRR